MLQTSIPELPVSLMPGDCLLGIAAQHVVPSVTENPSSGFCVRLRAVVIIQRLPLSLITCSLPPPTPYTANQGQIGFGFQFLESPSVFLPFLPILSAPEVSRQHKYILYVEPPGSTGRNSYVYNQSSELDRAACIFQNLRKGLYLITACQKREHFHPN